MTVAERFPREPEVNRVTEPKVSVSCEGRIDTALIPDYVGHNIAQVAFRSILEAWNDPDTRERYRRWKAARNSASLSS